MIDKACNKILIERNKMKGVPLRSMRGEREVQNKRDGASFIKLVARYCEDEKQLIVRSIGIDTAGSTSKDAAAGINSALKLFDSPGIKLKFQINAQMLVEAGYVSTYFGSWKK